MRSAYSLKSCGGSQIIRENAFEHKKKKKVLIGLRTTGPWFTNLEQRPLNRSQQLQAPYKPLIDEIKQN